MEIDANEMHKKMIDSLKKCNSLLLISPFSETQSYYLLEIGKEISERITNCLTAEKDGILLYTDFIKTYGFIHLWILGAYEFTRTLVEFNNPKHKKDWILSKDCYEMSLKFKKKLAEIRMPIAKQENRGNEEKTFSAALVQGFDYNKKDMIFKVKGKNFCFKQLFSEFSEILKSIKIDENP